MEARNPDQQSPDQRELRDKLGELLRPPRLRPHLRPFTPKREPATKDRVYKVVLQHVRMVPKEGFVPEVVRPRVLLCQAFQRSARAVSNARRKCLRALGETRTDVGTMQQHSRQPPDVGR